MTLLAVTVLEQDVGSQEPDGWMIPWQRACGSSTLHFGPFATYDEAVAWGDTHLEGLSFGLVPLYLTVDWCR